MNCIQVLSERFGVPDVAVGTSPSPRAEIKARGTFMRHVSDTSAYLNLGKTLLGVLLVTTARGGLTSKWVVVATCGERILFSLVIFNFPGQGVFANAPSVSLNFSTGYYTHPHVEK